MNRPTYKINPVRATCMSCEKDCGIHAYNDRCFSILSAYGNTQDPYMTDPNLQKMCLELVEKKRHETYGVGYCDHQQPYIPVTWGESPNYFVKLINQGVLPEKALEVANQMCIKNKPNIAEECMDFQKLLYNAIEEYSPPTKSGSPTPSGFPSPTASGSLSPSASCSQKYKSLTVANIVRNTETDESEKKERIVFLFFLAILVGAMVMVYVNKK